MSRCSATLERSCPNYWISVSCLTMRCSWSSVSGGYLLLLRSTSLSSCSRPCVRLLSKPWKPWVTRLLRRKSGELKVAMVEPVGGHGGMDYYDFGLCKGLSNTGAKVTLYTCDETRRRDVTFCETRFPYRRIYGDDPAWLRGVRYLRGSIQALLGAKLGRAQIAHFHFFHVGPLELFNVLLAKLLRLRVVVTAHDVQPFAKRLSVPWMVDKAYRDSDRVIAQSEVSKRELRTLLQEAGAKIATIPHGNYLHSIAEVPTREDARTRIGLPDAAQVLLFFGQIKEVKGLDVLLQAMPRLVEEFPDTVLLIAGKVWKDDF